MAFAKFEDNVYYFKYKGNNDYDMFVYCDYKYNYPCIYVTHNVGGKNSDGSYYNMIIESHKDPKEDEINGMTWADYQDMGTYIGGGHFGSNPNDIYNAVKNDDDIYEFFTVIQQKDISILTTFFEYISKKLNNEDEDFFNDVLMDESIDIREKISLII